MARLKQETVPPALPELLAKCEASYPGDNEKKMEWLLGIVSHCLTNKLFDAATLKVMRADAEKWPESIQKLLVGAL